MELPIAGRSRMNRRGSLLLETVLVVGIILLPLFFFQCNWLARKRVELRDLQRHRERYDGVQKWKSSKMPED